MSEKKFSKKHEWVELNGDIATVEQLSSRIPMHNGMFNHLSRMARLRRSAVRSRRRRVIPRRRPGPGSREQPITVE